MAPSAARRGRERSFFSSRGVRAVIIVLIAGGAALPFGLGKYFEFYTPDPFDSSGYVYSAQRILQGAKIGIEEKPSAQIGTLLVNMLGVKLFGYSEVGPKFLQGIFQAGALLLMFLALRKLFGLPAAGAGVIVAAIYLSAPVIAKFGNVKEQYMIACMVMAVSFLVFQQLGGRWWWAVLAGVFCIWAPMFKQTGLSVMGAIGLFIILQPVLRNRSWRQTGGDILWLWVGIFIGLAPVYVWKKAVRAEGLELPYEFIRRVLSSAAGSDRAASGGPTISTAAYSQPADEPKEDASATGALGPQEAPASQPAGYIGGSRALSTFAQQFWVVMRFYRLLILPIALAGASIIARVIKIIGSLRSRGGEGAGHSKKVYDRFVLLLAMWWLLDMGFVWISPRSYDQYYLPLNASGAMLGGYIIALYRDKLFSREKKGGWLVAGAAAVILMAAATWPILFGLSVSPHYGTPYTTIVNGERVPAKDKGYAQKLDEIARRRRGERGGYWEYVAGHIRQNSVETDRIYVWGWYPGIYVQSGRISSTPEAVYGTMHSDPPGTVAGKIGGIVDHLRAAPPKFIVDSQKMHYPFTDHPNFDLWPRGFGPNNRRYFLPAPLTPELSEQLQALVEKTSYEMMTSPTRPYGPMEPERARRLAQDERARHEAMYPLREYVMQDYRPVPKFGADVGQGGMFVFERIEPPGR